MWKAKVANSISRLSGRYELILESGVVVGRGPIS
jgi:hypothetical protein